MEAVNSITAGTEMVQEKALCPEDDAEMIEKEALSDVIEAEVKTDDGPSSVHPVESGDQPTPKNEGNPDSEMNEYSYLDREGFTSELFKVKLTNLTRHVSYSSLKKHVSAMKLQPRKIKIFNNDDGGGGAFALVTFADEKKRDEAITVLDGHEWKGRTVAAKKAKPKPDPLWRKRKGQAPGGEDEPIAKKERNSEDDLPPDIRLKNSVIPLWNLSYEDQLKEKTKSMETFIKKLGRNMDKLNKNLSKWVAQQRAANGSLCCKLEQVKPSPIQDGYRNKSEFTIGKSADGNERIVGFRYGKYRAGTCSVGEPSPCRNISEKSLELTQAFQRFVQSQKWDVYNPATSEGHWRMLLVRTTCVGDMLACAEFHPQGMTQDELATVKEDLKQYFTTGPGGTAGVTGMFFHLSTEKITGAGGKLKRELLFGKPHIQEKLLEMTFQISPDAFFQVNTQGAEVLYSTINSWCNIDAGATVLDVCCGTGTIGLTMAKHVKKVIGIDICQEAINDAKVNAGLNGVKNVEYHCGKAEDVLPEVIRNLFTRDIIAVVDPPRAGLHQRVIQSIRRYGAIDRLIYVSCNPPSAMQNFEDLMRPESKRIKGKPFVAIRAIPVDLFPHTMHCELVVLFERYSDKLLTSSVETQPLVKSDLSQQTAQPDSTVHAAQLQSDITEQSSQLKSDSTQQGSLTAQASQSQSDSAGRD
ncbi:tRNA (uracil-5-)-methyltransferase homolog A-like [Lineus longissimus]|uniref:tRNA (uracil-5-)-methyltransferase homolog A-like n=1 Tax=Lineus longissimus TaxID=88925 RepID=UPI002B4CF02A